MNSMKQFLLPLIILSTSGMVAHGQAKQQSHTASQNKPEFELRIQFKSPYMPTYEISSRIDVGKAVSIPVDINGLRPEVEIFNCICERLMPPRNGVYSVSLTPLMRMNGGCCLDGTSLLNLTPDTPYQWRVVPQGSVYCIVTLVTVKPNSTVTKGLTQH